MLPGQLPGQRRWTIGVVRERERPSTVVPDEASAAVMGVNLMDASLAPAAAAAGVAQGEAAAEGLAEFWTA